MILLLRFSERFENSWREKEKGKIPPQLCSIPYRALGRQILPDFFQNLHLQASHLLFIRSNGQNAK